MVAPNTARPTTTVNMPLSTTLDRPLVNPAATTDRKALTSSEVDVSSTRETSVCPYRIRGTPATSSSTMIWVMTTTMVVSPSVALGLMRI